MVVWGTNGTVVYVPCTALPDSVSKVGSDPGGVNPAGELDVIAVSWTSTKEFSGATISKRVILQVGGRAQNPYNA